MKNSAKLLSSFFSGIFPEKCRICNEYLDIFSSMNIPVCKTCLARFKKISGKRCKKCGIPLISEILFCTKCREGKREFYFDKNISIFEYENIRELIYLYKFKNEKKLSSYFASRINEIYLKSFSGIRIVPVPFRKRNNRQRGWDHMERISRILRDEYKIPILFLLKRKGKIPQKELNYHERVLNLKNKIVLKDSEKPLPTEILLLDDVFTTGSTANECSRVLIESGAGRISALTIAID